MKALYLLTKIFLIILLSRSFKSMEVLDNKLYMSSRQFKELASSGNLIKIYMGIDKNRFYSKFSDEFNFDFMYDSVLYSLNTDFDCDNSNLCLMPDKSKFCKIDNLY